MADGAWDHDGAPLGAMKAELPDWPIVSPLRGNGLCCSAGAASSRDRNGSKRTVGSWVATVEIGHSANPLQTNPHKSLIGLVPRVQGP